MPTQKTNKILIVEDDPLNRLFLVDLLKIHNLVPLIACNGKEAVEQWSQHDFFAILMDIQMPEMNGIEATRIIRQKEREEGRSKTAVIAVTAYNTQENHDACQQVGMDDYINKPVRIPDLLEVLRKYH